MAGLRGVGRIAPRTKSAGEAIAALDKLLRIRPDQENFQIAAADALADFGPAAESAVPDLIQILKESTGDRGVDRQAMSSAARRSCGSRRAPHRVRRRCAP